MANPMTRSVNSRASRRPFRRLLDVGNGLKGADQPATHNQAVRRGFRADIVHRVLAQPVGLIDRF